MKKHMVLLLAFSLLFSLVSCDLSTPPEKTPPTADSYNWESLDFSLNFGENASAKTEDETAPQTQNVEPVQSPGDESSDWVQFLKDYEAWVDRYVAFMQKYKANPLDLSLIADYANMMSEATSWSNRANEIQGTLKPEDLPEYLETYNRILSKINSI